MLNTYFTDEERRQHAKAFVEARKYAVKCCVEQLSLLRKCSEYESAAIEEICSCANAIEALSKRLNKIAYLASYDLLSVEETLNGVTLESLVKKYDGN